MRIKNGFLSETHPQTDDVVNHEGASVCACCVETGSWGSCDIPDMFHRFLSLTPVWYIHLFSCFRILPYTPSSVCSRCVPLTHSVLVCSQCQAFLVYLSSVGLPDLIFVCSYLCTQTLLEKSDLCVIQLSPLACGFSSHYTFFRISASQTSLPYLMSTGNMH